MHEDSRVPIGSALALLDGARRRTVIGEAFREWTPREARTPNPVRQSRLRTQAADLHR